MNWEKEFDEIGFGNQMRIVGTKRKGLKKCIREWLEQAQQQGARGERERVVGIIKNKWIGIVKNNADGAIFTAHEVCIMIHNLEEQAKKEGGGE